MGLSVAELWAHVESQTDKRIRRSFQRRIAFMRPVLNEDTDVKGCVKWRPVMTDD